MNGNKCIVVSLFDLQTTICDYTAPKNKMQEERGKSGASCLPLLVEILICSII